MYTITYNHQLSKRQLREVELLCTKCKRVDGNSIPIYPHLLIQLRTTSFNLLCYQNNQLIGFLSCFFFYEDAFEVALMVVPKARKQGIAKQLLTEMMPRIPTLFIKTLLFSTPSGKKYDWLIKHGFHYKNSEYQMQKSQKNIIPTENGALNFRQASIDDISIICTIDQAAFTPLFNDAEARFYSLLTQPNYIVLLVQKDGQIVGKAHLRLESTYARLSDIAVLPAFQGQGIGRALLIHCLNYCVMANLHNIILDVETANQHALNLYTHVGFNVKNAYDFWSIPTEKLSAV